MARWAKRMLVGTILLTLFLGWGCTEKLTVEEEQAISAALQAVTAVDQADYAVIWDLAPPFLQETVDKASWVQQFSYTRKSLGQVLARRFRQLEMKDRIAGTKVPGRYAVIEFGTSFDRKKSAVEVVTMALDPRDDEWKLVGYALMDADEKLTGFVHRITEWIRSWRESEDDAVREAKAASLLWLAALDRGRIQKTWETAGPLLREMTDQDQWERFVSGFRNELGALVSRELKEAVFTRDLPGAPDGRYVVIHYNVSYRYKKGAMERLVLERNGDREWQVAGYFITESPDNEQHAFNPLGQPINSGQRDPEAEQAGTKAQAGWLELMDKGDYPYCWQMGSALLQAVTSEKSFTEQMEFIRKPLGHVLSRELKETSTTSNLVNAPDGLYVAALYETSFEKKEAVQETVISRKEKDGQWRVSGYFIK